MARVFGLIWFSVLTIAAVSISLLLLHYDHAKKKYPTDFPGLSSAQIVFIGSSLTATALPSTERSDGVLGDGRSCAMLAVPAISELDSNRLLSYAIEAGAKTIFLEINAYAHDYVNLTEPFILKSLVIGLRDAGYRLAMSAKSLLDISRLAVPVFKTKCAARGTSRVLDAEQLLPRDYYRFVPFEPSYPGDLQRLLARAKAAGVEVILFSPPRPQAVVNMLGQNEYLALLEHLDHLAATFNVPIWYSRRAWPDDHFMDIMAHTNERGGVRFQRELVEWYEARK